MSGNGEDKSGSSKRRAPIDISDYIETIDDRVPSNPLPTNQNHIIQYDPNTGTYLGGPKWSRPMSGAGLRRPSSIRALVDRQNIDRRIFQAQQRITSHAEAIREASLMRTAATIATVQILNGEEVVALRDPYDHLSKLRFENAYRADPTVRRCVDVLAKFVMGKRTHFDIVSGTEEREEHMLQSLGFRETTSTSAGPNAAGGGFNASPVKTAADFQNMMDNGEKGRGMLPPPSRNNQRDEELEEEIEAMFAIGDREDALSEQEARELHRFISDINRRVKFHEKVKAALTQAYVYGRSVLLMETDGQGIPTDLKLLNSKKLETIYIDPQTWKLVAIDYADRPKEEPLLAEEIIYFANQDYHISPDTLYYGLSRIETIVHVSETNQLLDEIDLKEGARSMWAGSGVIKFPPDTADELVEEFVENFYPGTWNATSQNVQIDTYNLKLDYVALTNARMENDRRIIRGLGVPGFLVGFENISNRATAEEVMISWHESELDAERTWLQDVLEPQWFDYLIGKRFPELLRTKNDGSHIVSESTSPVRIKLDFQNISFETLKEKAEAIVPLFNLGLATPEKALELLRWQDQQPAVISELERREMEKQRQFELQFELQKQRANSYMLRQNQDNVEKNRQEDKDRKQATTANAALASLAMLHQKQEEKSPTNELAMLQMKLMQEAHQKDMDLRMKKAEVYDRLMKEIKRRESEAN